MMSPTPRNRYPIKVTEMKDLAQKQAQALNTLIAKINTEREQLAVERLGICIHEAIGALDLDETITRYQQLDQERSDLEGHFKSLIGDSDASIGSYVKNQRGNLALRFVQQPGRIPRLLREEVEYVAEQRGLNLTDIKRVPGIDWATLFEELKRFESFPDMIAFLKKQQQEVIAQMASPIQPTNEQEGA